MKRTKDIQKKVMQKHGYEGLGFLKNFCDEKISKRFWAETLGELHIVKSFNCSIMNQMLCE